MLNYETHRNELRVKIGWRDLYLHIYLYFCKNQTRSLDNELHLRKASPTKPITLIPTAFIETPLQLIQGALHYKLYANRVTRIKNQGLLLALLITGMKQLNELIELFDSELENGADYYLISVDVPLENLEGCTEIGIASTRNEPLRALVKNTRLLLSLI